MRAPSIVIELGMNRRGSASMLRWHGAIQRPVNSMLVVVIAERCGLAREVNPVPEKRAIQEFAADRADQSLDERVRDRDVGNGLDLGWPASGGSGIAGRDWC